MEQNIIVTIGIYKFLGVIGTLIVGSWYASHRLTRVETKVDTFDTRLTNMEGRLDHAFAGASPVALLPKGQLVLVDSGLKKYIDDHKDQMLDNCKSKNTMTNQYDIQEAVFALFDNLDFGNFELKLKEAAFKHGVTLDTIRRIGGIYFRDICLEKAGLKPEGLDKPKGNS